MQVTAADKTIIDKTQAVIHGVFDGMIIPNKHDEINRLVKLEKGSHVTGGIYARRVTACPKAEVDGPVFAHQKVESDGAVFKSEVGSSETIHGTNTRFFSGVTSNIVNLSKCIIKTNITARTAILKDCIILGLVIGTEKLEMKNCVCHTFKSKQFADLDNVQVLIPHAIVDGKLKLHSPIICPLLETEKGPVSLTEKDILKHDGATYLTISPRIMNLRKIKDNIIKAEELQKFLYKEVISDFLLSQDVIDFDKEKISEQLKKIIEKI
jgi:hypothetical protein